MPNLFSALPVEILAWVLASTSGLTRSATGAVRPSAGGPGRQQLELRLGLDVEAEDPGVRARGPSRGPSCRRRRRRSARPACRRPARGGARPPRPRRRRRPAWPACAAPRGWSWPSPRSRSAASRPAKAVARKRGSAAPAWPWNRNRPACRPPRRSPGAARPRHGARRRGTRNGSRVGVPGPEASLDQAVEEERPVLFGGVGSGGSGCSARSASLRAWTAAS